MQYMVKKKYVKQIITLGVLLAIVSGIFGEQYVIQQQVTESGTNTINLWLNMQSFNLLVGDYHTLILHGAKASQAKWKSTHPKVASVSSTGRVTAKKCGKTVIRVTYKKHTAKCSITVRSNNVKKELYSNQNRILKITKSNVKKYSSQQAMCTDEKGNVYIFRNKSNGNTKIYKITNTTGTVEGLLTTLATEEVAITETPVLTEVPVVTATAVASAEGVNIVTQAGVSANPINNSQGYAYVPRNVAVSETSVASILPMESLVTTSTAVAGVLEPVNTSSAAVEGQTVSPGAISPEVTTQAAVATNKPLDDPFFSQALLGVFKTVGHANDATYKDDSSHTEAGLYVATELGGSKSVVQISPVKKTNPETGVTTYKYKTIRRYCVTVPYKTKINGKTYKGKKNVNVSSITYDRKSKRFIIREVGSEQYYVGYFTKNKKFVTTKSFRIYNTVNGGNLDFYVRQGITYKDGKLYVTKSGHTNDVTNNSLLLIYSIGNLNAHKNKKGGKILLHKQKYYGSSLSASKRLVFDYKKTNANKYKFEMEDADFIGNKLVFITNEKLPTANAKYKSALYVKK